MVIEAQVLLQLSLSSKKKCPIIKHENKVLGVTVSAIPYMESDTGENTQTKVYYALRKE